MSPAPPLAHLWGYEIFALMWLILPLFVVKEPLTSAKRVGLSLWYLGALLTVATYLVTR